MSSILLALTRRMVLGKARAFSWGVLCLAAMTGLSGSTAYATDEISSLTLKSELVAQWQALDATQRAIGTRVKPGDWSAGVFIGSKQLGSILNQMVGYKLQNVTDNDLKGTTIIVKSAKLMPAMGYAEAQVSLHAQKGELQLDLNVLANISFQGVRHPDATDPAAASAYFRIEPLEIQPQLKAGVFHAGLKDFSAILFPQLALAFADPDFFNVAVPIKDDYQVPLAINKTDTTVVNKKTGATVTYQITLPPATLDEHLSFSAPVFRPEGISLLARLTADGQQLVLPGTPPTQSPAALQAQVATLKGKIGQQTAAFTGNADGMTVWLSSGVLNEMIQHIGGNTVTVQTVSSSGNLAQEPFRDPSLLLGDGIASATLDNSEKSSTTITLNAPQVNWSASAMTFSLPVKVQMSAHLIVNFVPKTLPAAHVPIGLGGTASGTLAATTTPAIASTPDVKVAALNTRLACNEVTADVASNGQLKVDVGWMSVPSIGVNTTMPLGVFQVAPIPLLDDGPIFVAMPARDPQQQAAAPAGKSSWAFIPPVAALRMRVIPQSVTQSASGYAMSVTIDSQPINTPGTKTAMDSARNTIKQEAEAHKQKVSDLLRGQKPSKCTGDPTIEVLLGPVAIGSKDQIVQWARANEKVVEATLDPTTPIRVALAAAEKAGIKIDPPKLPLPPLPKKLPPIHIKISAPKW
jgi:hypothetical protein